MVDGPGVGDTRLNSQDAVKLVIRAMEQAMVANPRGYHAFLLVVRFGGRFTAEDEDTIVVLKQIFGEDFVRQFCILVLSGGDIFEAEESGRPFEHWCAKQTGVFQDLLRECGNRVVLFDNVTKDEAKQNLQIDKLLALVRGLTAQGQRYTGRYFELARAARQKAVVESKSPEIREGVLQETSLILQKLNSLTICNDPQQIPDLQTLLTRCNGLITWVQAEDQGTGTLQDLLVSIVSLRGTVEGLIHAQSRVAEERRQSDAEKMSREASEAREQKLKDELMTAREELEEKTKELDLEYKKTKEISDEGWKGKVWGFLKTVAEIAVPIIVEVVRARLGVR